MPAKRTRPLTRAAACARHAHTAPCACASRAPTPAGCGLRAQVCAAPHAEPQPPAAVACAAGKRAAAA
eukprot:115849-Prymnesium_polylepis.1